MLRHTTLKKRTLLIVMLLTVLLSTAQAVEDAVDRASRMAWWQEARFGMFIHWGLYAVPAGTYQGKQIEGIGEWIMQRAPISVEEYEKFAPQFNPVKFDADAWVRMAQDAGMKYIVITSKHHDGFCLWDSQVTQWDIMDASPFKRDILKELADACEQRGVRLCFYHSIMDWHHPDAQAPFYPKYNDRSRTNPNFSRYVETYMKPQLEELLTHYGPVGVLWFDGEWITDWTEPQGKDLYRTIRTLSPNLIVNNRVGKGRKGMEGMNKGEGYAGDFGTPEQQIPATGLGGVDWETCMTMNDTWGYKSYDDNWKSTKTLIQNLVDIASKGGNYLLNIGPKADGTFPQASIDRLKEIGQWMRINSQAVYGTTASPTERPAWGRITTKSGENGSLLYLHVFDWPADGRLPVAIKNEVTDCYLLADTTKTFEVSSSDGGLTVKLQGNAPDPVCSVVVLRVKGRP
ncbi:alpha-L-fucosidase [Planctomycetota bacterium]